MRFLRAAIALSMLALVWMALRGTDANARLADMSPGWALAAFVALSVQTWLSAWRWRLTARQLGIRMGAFHALMEYYLGQLVNQILPGGMVGDVGRALRSAAPSITSATDRARASGVNRCRMNPTTRPPRIGTIMTQYHGKTCAALCTCAISRAL